MILLNHKKTNAEIDECMNEYSHSHSQPLPTTAIHNDCGFCQCETKSVDKIAFNR